MKVYIEMALKIADRVREMTNVAGTNTIILSGAQPGYVPFSSYLNDNDSTWYCVVDQIGGQWEVGLGTYHLSSNALSRTTIISSSSANQVVSFAGGRPLDIFSTIPASVLASALGL
jgi:hypothetical protein